MPVRKRPDTGAWEVTVCWRGRTTRRSSARWTRDQARTVERKLLQDIADLEAGGKPKRTIAEAVERWLLEYAPRLKDDCASKVRPILPFIHSRPLGDLPAVAEEIKAAFSELQPATINRRLAILRRVGNLASDQWDWIDEPIGRRVKLLQESNQRHVYLSAPQVADVAERCGNPHAADLIVFAAYTGIRQGHMLRLTHHDLRGDRIELDTSSKTGRPLLLPLHPKALEIAKRLPLPISKNELRREWESARKSAGLPHVRWHDLRHTCASWYVQAGVPIIVVRDLLGHAVIATTMRYAHLHDDNLRDAVKRIA